MKKILLFAALLAWSSSAFAQAGSLTIVNNLKCSVYVNVLATETFYLDAAGCSLGSNLIIVSALTTYSWSDPSNFTVFGGPSPAVGWASQAAPIPAVYWTSPCCLYADFTWTDAVFQFGCLDCGSGGNISDPAASPTCYGYPSTWAGGTCGYTATWVSSSVYPMNNVTLTFNY